MGNREIIILNLIILPSVEVEKREILWTTLSSGKSKTWGLLTMEEKICALVLVSYYLVMF